MDDNPKSKTENQQSELLGSRSPQSASRSPLSALIRFCLESKFMVVLVLLFLIMAGVMVAPFDWELGWLPRNPVPTDAIPDIGENQQIVFTEWMGRSPQDVDDQVTYPLTASLLGIPGVKAIRGTSMFGFSSISIIFDEDREYYWTRTRILERLNSLPPRTLPEGVQPILGPDATALGQIFWYTLEGHDLKGRPVGGWDLDELRSIQDWYVRYALLSARGVSEVASVGGFVREYQVDVDPDAMRAHGVSLQNVMAAVRLANLDVGARSIEVNSVDYSVRGIGFIKQVGDIEKAVIKVTDNVPIYVRNVANVTLGPAWRSGALDKEGAEVVGGVVVVSCDGNPLEAIDEVKKKIADITPGLPKRTLSDGTVSKVTIVPFYDRTDLIHETLETLNEAIFLEILVTIIVVLIMVRHLASSVLISALLPVAVLMTFVAMKLFHVDANIVALSGIAIAIGTMVDMGIIISENILHRLGEASKDGPLTRKDALVVIHRATTEVGSAVLTAVLTTIIGFLPVLFMEAAEGKMFRPLAFTKTSALIASIIVALTIIPPFAHILFTGWACTRRSRILMFGVLLMIGAWIAWDIAIWAGLLAMIACAYKLFEDRLPPAWRDTLTGRATLILAVVVTLFLTTQWLPLGPAKGFIRNLVFVGATIGGLLTLFYFFRKNYTRILRWALDHKIAFLSTPLVLVLGGMGYVWQGPAALLGGIPHEYKQPFSTEELDQLGHMDRIKYNLAKYQTKSWESPDVFRDQALFDKIKWTLARDWKGRGKEFMPSLDEGSFLYMPSTMPHASIGEALDAMQKQDMAILSIPEVEQAVGKLGRAETPLDPAPFSMVETIINYKPQHLRGLNGDSARFRYDVDTIDFFRDEHGAPISAPDGKPYKIRGRYPRDVDGKLIPSTRGKPFRLWRPALDPELNEDRRAWGGIHSPNDIWDEVQRVADVPGSTLPPKLQPIETRLLMLQTGMRAAMGLKIKGPDLSTIEKVGFELERLLRQAPGVNSETVNADRIIGKPYLEIEIDREAIARYGVRIQEVQDVIEVAIGGKTLTTTVEGRESYPVRVRYQRELRDSFEALERILVPGVGSEQIPLIQLADIRHVRGPEMIKSEDTFLVGYVLFDKKPGFAEVEVVENAQQFLNECIQSGDLVLPAGVSYTFAGSYENQLRATRRLMVVVPFALLVIFMILFFQFRSFVTSTLVFSGILVAWAGGFIMLWLYAQPWFMDFSILGTNMRELFQVHPVNLSVPIWIGFLALFGIASDDGVIMATILDQTFESREISSVADIREATIVGAQRRIRPALMTSATTILVLMPVLTSSGRGAGVMIPMAIPSFGGMAIALITVFVVPVLYCSVKETTFKRMEAKRMQI